MKTHRVLSIMMAAAVGVTACGSDDDVGTGDSVDRPSTSAPVSIVGDPSGAWVLVGGPSEPIPGWDVTVEIDNDRIGGVAACNGYGGTVEIGEGTIAVSDLSWTEMGCQSDVQQLEQAFLEALGAVSTYSVSGEQLQITTPEGVWRFDRLTVTSPGDEGLTFQSEG